jgi:hypothetical protein
MKFRKPFRRLSAKYKASMTFSKCGVAGQEQQMHFLKPCAPMTRWCVVQLLRNFGDVLVVNATPLTKLPRMRSGSLLSLPGSVEHAGPATNKFRAVIFFSANPAYEAVADYDPDQQYTDLLLCGHLMSLLWQQPLVGDAEREFLLTAMAHYNMEEQEADVEQHLGANHFAQGPSECEEALQKMVRRGAAEEALNA